MRVLSFFLFMALLALPPAQVDTLVRLDAEAGFDGYYRANAWVPVFVTLSNDGPDIQGELRIRPQNSLQAASAADFSTPITLPNRSRKQITLFAALDSSSTGLIIELLHEGTPILQQRYPLTRVQTAGVLYAVASDTLTTAIHPDRVRPFIGEAYQADITLDLLPPQAGALTSLDALIITDADTGQLTDMQRQALADWVLGGGHLIVGGGATWQRTTAGLEPLLPVRVEDTRTVEGLDILEDYLGRRDGVALRDAPAVVTTGTPTEDAEVLLALDSDVPLIARRRHGHGVIDYLALDPAAEPLASWNNTPELWATLFATVEQRPSWQQGFGRASSSWQNAQQATDIIPRTLPEAGLLFGFLSLYVILIGPLNYLVLKRFRRRELAWLTIPAGIVIFSLLAYLTGFGLRGTSAIVNRLNVVQVWPDAERARVDGLVGVWSPFRTTYNIQMPPGHSLYPIPAGGGFFGGGSGTGVTIEEDGGYTAREVPVNIGSVRSFATHGYIDAPPTLESDAALEYVFHASAESPIQEDSMVFSGTLTNPNAFTLQDAVLLARGVAYPLDDLEPGETKPFSFTLPEADPNGQAYFDAPPVALGADFAPDSAGYGSPQRNRSMTARDILGTDSSASSRVNYAQAQTQEAREARRRERMLHALVYDLEPTGGRGDGLYLAAWTDQTPVDVTLAAAEYTAIDSTLYLFRVPVTVEVPTQPVVIGPAQMSWMLSEESTRRDLMPVSDPDARMWLGQSTAVLRPEEQVAYRFTPFPGARLEEVTDLVLTLESSSTNRRVPYRLWDWDAGVWVTPGKETHIRDPAPFVGPEGAVKVMVYNQSAQIDLLVTRVEVTLRGTF